MLSSVSSIVLNHNPVISSKPVNLQINNLVRIQNQLLLNYYKNSVFISLSLSLSLSPSPLVFHWWINNFSYFRLTWELKNNSILSLTFSSSKRRDFSSQLLTKLMISLKRFFRQPIISSLLISLLLLSLSILCWLLRWNDNTQHICLTY